MTFRSTALWVMLACLTISGISCSRDPNVRKEKYLELGKRYLSAEKYPEAAIEFSKAIQIDSNFAEAHYQLSRAEIRQGEFLGAVGDSGRVTAPHLHYEVRIGKTPVNPYRYLMATTPVQQAKADFPF